ncbi:hypothetical protein EV401DRAFT_2013980 [Pisolithus croceorrhizus]|nr:hypothetical protein EV401DRAFT_2013980 [Pisolithus croceorrhizus]
MGEVWIILVVVVVDPVGGFGVSIREVCRSLHSYQSFYPKKGYTFLSHGPRATINRPETRGAPIGVVDTSGCRSIVTMARHTAISATE